MSSAERRGEGGKVRRMQTDLEGNYLDGQTAIRQRALVRLTTTGLQISTENGASLWWPYKEIRQSQHSLTRGRIELEKGEKIPEIIQVHGRLFLKRLQGVAPEVVENFYDPTRKKSWVVIALFCILGIAGVTGPLYFWGIPAMATRVASYVPVSWEEELGQAVLKHLAPPERQCLDPQRTQVIDEIVRNLTQPLGKSPYEFRVIVVNDSAVNAFAAPGGYIIVFYGLLEHTRTPEELAGVLAHEMQHILHRHATRALLQRASIGILLSAAVGDASAAMNYGVQSAGALGVLRYNRQSEEEADREGIRMLTASGIDPRGLATFFEGLRKENKKSLGLPAYLSTHPDLEERIQYLKLLAEKSPRPSTPLLPAYNWKDIYGFCPGAHSTR